MIEVTTPETVPVEPEETIDVSSTTVYIIKEGDTLWDIAGSEYGDNFKWPIIWKQNSYIENADLIYPGNELHIPSLKDGPGPEPEIVAVPTEPYTPPVYESYHYEGEQPDWDEVSYTEIDDDKEYRDIDRTYRVPADVVLSAGYIKDEQNFISSGYVLGDVVIRGKQMNTKGDEVVLSFTKHTPGIRLGDSYLIYRLGKKVKDLDRTKKYLGRIVEIVGVLMVNELGEESSKGTLIKSFTACKKGDLIRPYHSVSAVNDFTTSTPTERIGYIIASRYNVIWPTQPQNIVYIDFGRRHGIHTGNVFNVYRLLEKIKEPKSKQMRYVYKEFIGKLYVINVEEDSATCTVLEAKDILEIGNYVKYSNQW
ncbi:LysM peptidoglycan-binding domain-containing protein [Candidatus Dependentiae bacterium]|nr:LysM peptidoglycan-binding domain-containing protein [Candidatus Dependentiae bacterium]